jgi:hypothetical protein
LGSDLALDESDSLGIVRDRPDETPESSGAIALTCEQLAPRSDKLSLAVVKMVLEVSIVTCSDEIGVGRCV